MMFNPLCKKITIVLYSETRKYGLKFSTSIVFHPLDYYTLSDFTTTLYFFQKQRIVSIRTIRWTKERLGTIRGKQRQVRIGRTLCG